MKTTAMNKIFITTLLTTVTTFSFSLDTVVAANAVYFDGASPIISTTDPFFHPIVDWSIGETGARYFVLNFSYSSLGQTNWGYVIPWEVMFPENNYEASIRLLFNDSSKAAPSTSPIVGDGFQCPQLQYYINILGGLDETWSRIWLDDQCNLRPDPTLYSSGAAMGLELDLTDGYGDYQSYHWLTMAVDNVLPQDGQWYNVQVYVSTGTVFSPPWAKFIITQKYGPSGTLSDFVYFDSSYYYMTAPDGFSIPLGGTANQGGEQPMFWQVGCSTRDTNYSDTCYTGALSNLFFYPTNNEYEIIPYGTTIGRFLTGNNTAADLGVYGTNPFNYPPEVFQTGDDTTFVYNSADIASGSTNIQQYTIEGWQRDIGNPNYSSGIGAGIQVNATDPF